MWLTRNDSCTYEFGLSIVNFIFFFLFSIKTSHAHTHTYVVHTHSQKMWAHDIHKHGAFISIVSVIQLLFDGRSSQTINGTKCMYVVFFFRLNTTDSKIYGNWCLFGAHAIPIYEHIWFHWISFQTITKTFCMFLWLTIVVAVRLHGEFDEKLITSTWMRPKRTV